MQKQMYTYFIFSAVLLNSFISVHAQNIDSLLGIFKQADPQEKLYIHFDKNYYSPGETIWFKAYIFDGLERAAAPKNFYAELIDEAGNVLTRFTAPVGESSAAGSFGLAPNFSKSLIYFRAYTTAMLNGDTSFLYVKPIRILTSTKSIKNKTPLPVSISFLPEGGDMIAETPAVLAFKVTDANGLPVNAKGYIKGADGNKLGDFVTVHDGMGWFKIEPKQGQSYTAVWKDAAGKEYNTPLPPVKPQGVSLQVSDAGEGKKFILQRSENVTEEAKALRIIAYMNQQLVYYAKVNLSSNTITSGIIPTKQLPSGILQVSVFDKNFKPVAERVTFVNNHDYEFDADAWIPVLNKNKRGLNTLEVMVSDTFRSNLSLSVTDADLNVPNPNEDNIISHLLLTADLHGKVANPYYYFFSTADSASIYLDLVMLTNGWRRYKWDSVFAGKAPPNNIKESNYLSIDGKLIGVQAGRFGPDTKLNGILQTKDSAKNFISLPVNRKGEVLSDGYIFYDFAKLYFQFNDKKLVFDKSLLHVDNGLYKSPAQLLLNEESRKTGLELDTMLIAKNIKKASDETKVAVMRARREKEQLLQEVIVKGKVKSNEQKMDEKYASGMFSGGDARNFDVMNDPFAAGSQSIFQYLQGKVAGLQINTSGGTPSLSWRGGSPVFYLDEIQTDVSFVQNLNMNDVAYVKVFSPGTTGVISSSGGGAIAIYTKKGGDRTSDDKSKGLDYVQITGYSPVKEFYSPDYATASALNDLPDLRTTLYWSPYILLDKTKKRVKIMFYNNDITKRFRVVLEGINSNDKFARVEKVIE
ncbi:MAG TPA: hypothetical protein VK645_20345 [Chitinophagaceae bacterium]|nr:hypothetical protein [Chitinophagaceae bacterium]